MVISPIHSIAPPSAGHPGNHDPSESDEAAARFAAALDAAARANARPLPVATPSKIDSSGSPFHRASPAKPNRPRSDGDRLASEG